MINLLYSLLLNQENQYTPTYTATALPLYLENIRPTLYLDSEHSVIKCVQLCLSTELRSFLTETLKRSTINTDSGKHMEETNYPLVIISGVLRNNPLTVFKAESYKNLSRSIVDNLLYVFYTHTNPIYSVAAFVILWALNAEKEYTK